VSAKVHVSLGKVAVMYGTYAAGQETVMQYEVVCEVGTLSGDGAVTERRFKTTAATGGYEMGCNKTSCRSDVRKHDEMGSKWKKSE
jgi:hypothetical protein